MSLGGDIVLHGTNEEWSIGRPASHGCLRMKNRDVEELAWFLQSRFSPETDQGLLEKYRRDRGQTFYVKLNRMIPVTILYDRVAVHDREVKIHPDIYGRESNLWGEVMAELLAIGIQPWEVDPVKLEEIEGTSSTVTVSIYDLLTASAL